MTWYNPREGRNDDLHTSFESYIPPQNEGDIFIPTGWANAPLHQNWSKTTSGYASNQGKCGGWLLHGDPLDPENTQVSWAETIEGLATPDVFPLDFVIVHGVNRPKVGCLGQIRGTNYTKKQQPLDLVALALYYDLETKDPASARGWLSMESIPGHYECDNLRFCQNFRQQPLEHFFDPALLKKRATRFNKKLKERFG